METYFVFYTAADGSWLGYNKFFCFATSIEDAEQQFIKARREHPMRLRYEYNVVKEAQAPKTLDTRKKVVK